MIYLPLEHIESRYTTHLDRDIREYIRRKKLDVRVLEPVTIGERDEVRENHGSFLDADKTVFRQFHQFNELLKLVNTGVVKGDETLFVSDIWNFALLAVPYLNFFSGYNFKVRGILHAGSFTDTDFVRQMERVYKGFEESLFDICDRIFVGSNFCKNDVIQKRYVNPEKIVVTGLPLDIQGLKRFKSGEKTDTIVFNGRNVDEKQPWLFDELRNRLPQYEYINTQKSKLSKEDYYKTLARAKIVVSFALQENFGYGVQEAVALGCIPVVPDRLAYVEQFSKKYRYKIFDECVTMVKDIMEGRFVDDIHSTSRLDDSINQSIFDKWFEG